MMASEKPSGPGAEILGDDEATGAVAFEPQHREHRLERIVHIGALRRRRSRTGSGTGAGAGRHGRCGSRRHGACWPTTSARKAASPSSSRASGLKGGRPQFCPVGPKGSGGDRPRGPARSAPARSRSRSRPGRRRRRDRGRGRCPFPPHGPARPLRRAGGPRAIAARRGTRPARNSPPGTRRTSRRSGVSIGLGPFAEPPGVPAPRKASDRASKVRAPECVAALPAEARERGMVAARRNSPPEGLEERPLQSPDGGVVDERSIGSAASLSRRAGISRNRGAPPLGEALARPRVDEERFEEEAGGGRIGRDLAPIRREERVDRAEPRNEAPSAAVAAASSATSV